MWDMQVVSGIMRLLLVTYLLGESMVMSNKCSINLKGTQKKPTPVIMLKSAHGSYKLFEPTGTSTTVSETELDLACTGDNSIVTSDIRINPNTKYMTLICKKDSNSNNLQNFAWFYGEFNVDPDTIFCNKVPQSEIMKTNTICAMNNYVSHIGFKARDGSHVKLYEYCYNTSHKFGLYTKHILNGFAPRTPTTINRRFCYDDSCFMENYKYPSGDQQKTTFNALFFQGQSYISSGSFIFAVGHYAPCADFVYEYEQIASNYYVNAAPQYQGFNNGNWKRIENKVRESARKRATKFEIYTGALDTLKLHNPRNNEQIVEIVLDAENCTSRASAAEPSNKKSELNPLKFKVPKYFYKVILDGNSGVAFIGLNDITTSLTVGDALSSFCTNICMSKNHESFLKKSSGLTICCTVNNFLQNTLVKNVLPNLGTGINNLLDIFQ